MTARDGRSKRSRTDKNKRARQESQACVEQRQSERIRLDLKRKRKKTSAMTSELRSINPAAADEVSPAVSQHRV